MTLSRDQPLTKIVFNGNFDQSVGKQVGILGDAADALRFVDQGVGEAPSQLAILGTQQATLLRDPDESLSPSVAFGSYIVHGNTPINQTITICRIC
jgi:hypothetical protein